jgi:hypothetical protein
MFGYIRTLSLLLHFNVCLTVPSILKILRPNASFKAQWPRDREDGQSVDFPYSLPSRASYSYRPTPFVLLGTSVSRKGDWTSNIHVGLQRLTFAVENLKGERFSHFSPFTKPAYCLTPPFIFSRSSTMSNQSLSPDPIPTHQTGRMSRVPGNRTPRRVQWASEVDSAADKDEAVGRRHENGLESDADSTRELDEAALDVRATPVSHSLPSYSSSFPQPGAFQTLTHALERHRSSSVSASPHSAVAAPPLQPRLSTSSSVESSSGPDSPKILSHNTNVPGEAFIEPGERAGLPMQRSGSKKDQFSDSEARAATVVRAHSVNPFSRRFFRRRTRPTPARPSKSENTDTEKAAAADATSPMTRAHGGILSALLALYDHDSDSASISSTLRTSSGRVTPEPHSHESPTHSFIDLASASGRRLADMSKSLHLPETRPSRERNAAGVFGSLIASTTGTLVGAAAPTHSAIAPDIKRPGYHLSRCVHGR